MSDFNLSLQSPEPAPHFWKISVVPVDPDEQAHILYFRDQLDAGAMILRTDLLKGFLDLEGELFLQELDVPYAAGKDFLVLDTANGLRPKLIAYLDSQHVSVMSRVEVLLHQNPLMTVEAHEISLEGDDDLLESLANDNLIVNIGSN